MLYQLELLPLKIEPKRKNTSGVDGAYLMKRLAFEFYLFMDGMFFLTSAMFFKCEFFRHRLTVFCGRIVDITTIFTFETDLYSHVFPLNSFGRLPETEIIR